jgi:hypothetical protein
MLESLVDENQPATTKLASGHLVQFQPGTGAAHRLCNYKSTTHKPDTMEHSGFIADWRFDTIVPSVAALR